MAVQIQLRRDTAANWTSVNPVLAEGEQGLELDTGKRKTGNGSDAWTDLPYDAGGTGGAPDAHAASHATGGSDPITPAAIGAATAAQGAKADTAIQPGNAALTDERVPTAAGLTSKFGTAKATIADGDKFAGLDSAASDAPKHWLWSTIKTTLATYFDTLYAAIAHTHSAFTGDSGAGGAAGFVPAPGAGDAAADKYLHADGTFKTPADGGGLTHFTEARNDSSPNATVPVVSLTATGAETNIDVAIVPKGDGAILTAVPDGTSVGGNKRGARAVDLQRARSLAAEVASGPNSVVLGGKDCIASSSYSMSGGQGCKSTSFWSLALGNYSTASAIGAQAFTRSIANQDWSTAIGYSALAHRPGMFALANGGNSGAAQFVVIPCRIVTSGNTPAEMRVYSSWGANNSNRILVPSGSGFSGVVEVFGFKSDGSAAAIYARRFAIKNVSGTTSLIGSVQVVGVDHEDAATGIAITADDTNDAMAITVTGVDGEDWYWSGALIGVETKY